MILQSTSLISTTANSLATTGASVNCSNAVPPVAGQVWTAASATQGVWQNVTSSSGNLIDVTSVTYGVSTSNTAAANATAFYNANAAAISAGKLLYIPTGAFNTNAVTLTAQIADSMGQLFSTSASVTINNGLPVRPEWFGSSAGNIRLAVNALPSTGGVIQLENKRYPPSYVDYTTPTTGYLAKPNVRIQGVRLPEYMADNSGLKDGSGSIINGLFCVFADGFEWDKVGVDSGVTICNSLYGGVAQECFAFFQTNKSVPVYATGVRIESIRGISKSAASAVHSILLEAINGGYIGYAEGGMATHGVVIKSRNITADTLLGFNCGTDCVIIKSDSYAPMNTVTVDKVIGKGAGIGTSAYGLLIQAATSNGSKVNIGSVYSENCTNGILFDSNSSTLSDVNIGQVIVDTATTGIEYNGSARTNIGEVIAMNCTIAVDANSATTAKSNYIGRVVARSCTYGVSSYGSIHVGDVVADTVSSYILYHGNTAARILVSGTINQSAGSATLWGMTAPLINSWANNAGGDSSYSLTTVGGKVVLSGTIKSGTSATLNSAMSVQVRPAQNLRYTALGYNGAAWTPIELIVGSDGILTAVNYTAASTWLSLDGISWPTPY
jgi:hypothetical protein